jgi:hypothetical protein
MLAEIIAFLVNKCFSFMALNYSKIEYFSPVVGLENTLVHGNMLLEVERSSALVKHTMPLGICPC